MGIRSFRPTTPSRRHTTGNDFAEVTKGNEPERSLLDRYSMPVTTPSAVRMPSTPNGVLILAAYFDGIFMQVLLRRLAPSAHFHLLRQPCHQRRNEPDGEHGANRKQRHAGGDIHHVLPASAVIAGAGKR